MNMANTTELGSEFCAYKKKRTQNQKRMMMRMMIRPPMPSTIPACMS